MEWCAYLFLAASTVFAVLRPDRAAGERLVTLALVAATVVWVYAMFTRAPKPRIEQRRRMIVYFVGLLALATRADDPQPDVLHLRDHRLLPRRRAAAIRADDRRRGRDLDPDQHGDQRVPVAVGRPVVPVRGDHRHPDRRHRFRDGPRRAAVRAERAAPSGRRPAPGRHGRERRAPATAGRAGTRGGRARRARPHGARDPRHHRPRADRDRHPAGGRRTGERPAGRLATPRRQRHPAGAREPVRGPSVGRGVAAGGPRGGDARGRAGRRRRRAGRRSTASRSSS